MDNNFIVQEGGSINPYPALVALSRFGSYEALVTLDGYKSARFPLKV